MHVVVVGVHLDPLGRPPDELLPTWRDFGRPAGAAARTGVRMTVTQAAWSDWDTEVDGVACHFVRERVRPIIRLPRGHRFLRRPRRLFDVVRGLNPDLVHFEGLIFPRQVRALGAALPGVPIVAQDHASRVPQGWRRLMHRWGFARLAGAMFTARAQADPFVAAGVLRRDLPIFDVVEGSSPFTPGDQATARAATGLTGDPCLLWVGNLDRNKDPLTVLEAVSLVLPELPDLRVWMCYRYAPLLEQVRARIANYAGLAARVHLLGEVPYPGIETYFQAADFLVQASHREGSGFGVIEALACGTTPLVTDIPSFRRITGAGAFGALVPTENPAALAGAIRDWSAGDRVEQRRRAREHFQRELSFDAIGRQLRRAYQEILAADDRGLDFAGDRGLGPGL